MYFKTTMTLPHLLSYWDDFYACCDMDQITKNASLHACMHVEYTWWF
jgi:hypothetical protein